MFPSKFCLILLTSAFLVLCCVPALADRQGLLNIVTTTSMIWDVTREVAGSRAQVHALMGSGVDPHLYKPTRSDMAALLDAEVVFYNGLMLEGKMTGAIQRMEQAERAVFAVTELIPRQFLLASEAHPNQHDPHVWMDPAAWQKVVELIARHLEALDPPGSDIYRRSAVRYLGNLEQLDQYATRVLASVPQNARVLVTSHDAFRYFGRRFNFEVLGIQGLSTESEAGVRDIEHLVDLLVSRRVQAVFVESTVSPRNLKALLEGAAARGHNVRIGGELFSDAMGAPGTYEGTYIGMIDHNVTVIARALGGEAPGRGMQGLLKENHEQ